MNVHDSERMAGLLDQAGYEPTTDDRDADVIVINTCSVREKAEEKLFTRLGEIPPDAARDRAPAGRRGGRLRRAAGRCADPATLQGRRRHHRHAESETAADARRRRRSTRPRGARRSIDLDPLDDVSFPLGIARRERSRQGLRHHHRRLQRVLRLLRRAVHARARADAAGGRHPRGRAPRGRHRREGNPAARADRQPLPGARRSRLRLRRRCSSG